MRAIVNQLLTTDVQLLAMGVGPTTVWHNYDADQRPTDSLFVVIRWGAEDYDDARQRRAFRHFDLYVHDLQNKGSDVLHTIDNVLNRVDDVFDAANDVEVELDGYKLGYIEPEGRSPDFDDEGYETFCRYGSYKAIADKLP